MKCYTEAQLAFIGEQSNKMMDWMNTFAKMVFSSLVIINGGAIISLLTFLGNAKFIKNFSNLWFWAISSYCLGIIFIILGMVFAYWTQKIFREGKDLDIINGFETSDLNKNKIGVGFRVWAIVLSSLSLLLFVLGGIFSIYALSQSF